MSASEGHGNKNLHRAAGKPDWENVDPSSYNFFQKMAAATHGVISPANVISVVGFGIVLYGLLAVLNDHFWLGLILLAVGRLFDILDGTVAQATQTKSPLGELLDATIDKIVTLLTIIVLVVADIASWWIIIALLVPQITITAIILYKRKRGNGVHPTRAGKLSMATAWTGIIGLLLVKALDSQAILGAIVNVLIGVSLVLGIYALWQYTTNRN